MQYQQRTQSEIIRQQRIETLFKECEQSVIQSTLGTLGLNTGMFTDHDGGNVTTMHNFERNDTDKYVAEKDKNSYKEARKEYSRNEYEISNQKWKEKRNSKTDENGKTVDGYTGETIDAKDADLDHVRPLKSEVSNKKNHLAYNTGTKEGKEEFREVLNDDKNLTMTKKSINRSKGAKTNEEYLKPPERQAGESELDYQKRCNEHQDKLKNQGVNNELMMTKDKEAEEHINTNGKLWDKQKGELINTGIQQAKAMALNQIMGSLLTKMSSILFTEIRYLIREGKTLNIDTISELGNRAKKHLKRIISEVPEMFGNALKGGISGFVSNLLTFIINNFISTAKRFVTIMREGLLGIWRAIKMIFFPPKGMSKSEIWRSAIKILSTTILSAVFISFSEIIKNFLLGFPLLAPIANILSAAIVGILGGLSSALASYLIDTIFDYSLDNRDEQAMDLLIQNSEKQNQMVNYLLDMLSSSHKNIESYDLSIGLNQVISDKFDLIGTSINFVRNNTDQMLFDLNSLIHNMENQAEKMKNTTASLDRIHNEIELFLKVRGL